MKKKREPYRSFPLILTFSPGGEGTHRRACITRAEQYSGDTECANLLWSDLGVVSDIWSRSDLFLQEFDRVGVRELFDDHFFFGPRLRETVAAVVQESA